MSVEYFKTPEAQSFLSEFEHFEYSQLFVETFAFATHDDWEIAYHRQDLIRHHKTFRSPVFKAEGSKGPIPFDDLESTRTTFIEMKNGTKKVEKVAWTSQVQKNAWPNNGMEELFKIKDGTKLLEELSNVQSSSKIPQISDPSGSIRRKSREA